MKIKFNKLSKKMKIALCFCIGLLCIGLPASLIAVSLTSSVGNFVLGNYTSYMSPDVMDVLRKQYGLSFDYYESSDAIAYNLRKNNMDIVVSTSYETISLIKDDLLHKINWSNFNLNITNSNDALNYFTPVVQKILTNYDFDNDGNNDNLLDYAVPYFLQDLIFIYRGDKLSIANNASWLEILELIKTEKRFNPVTSNSKLPLLGMIDDSRTVYSLAKIISNSENINPIDNVSIEELTSSYINLASYFKDFGEKSILFADSNTLLNKIAYNELNGGIFYNGDGIFSSLGGDDQIEINNQTFHVVKPTDTLVALDLMTINKNISKNHLDKSYQIINDLCLSFNEQNAEEEVIFLNFDYVNYTPALNSLYEYIKNGDYFDGNLKTEMLQLYEINNAKYIEDPISNITKSNLSFAYIAFKQTL